MKTALGLGLALWIGSVSNLVPSPGSLPIFSSVPGGVVTNTATTSWTINLGALLLSNWSLAVSATAPACMNAPLSAITVRCTAITDTGITLLSSHSCAGQFNLSTAPQIVATGQDTLAILNGHRSVTIDYTFSDQWKYYATSGPCNVSLNYTLTSL